MNQLVANIILALLVAGLTSNKHYATAAFFTVLLILNGIDRTLHQMKKK